MTKKHINIGASANDKAGDPIRTAFDKVNQNFTELYARTVNTDAQTLTLVGNTLTIVGGNSVTLPTISVPTDISDLTDTEGLLDENLEIDGGSASTNYTAELTINGGGA